MKYVIHYKTSNLSYINKFNPPYDSINLALVKLGQLIKVFPDVKFWLPDVE